MLGLIALSISKLEHAVTEIVAHGYTIGQHTVRLYCFRICISIQNMRVLRQEKKQVIAVCATVICTDRTYTFTGIQIAEKVVADIFFNTCISMMTSALEDCL